MLVSAANPVEDLRIAGGRECPRGPSRNDKDIRARHIREFTVDDVLQAGERIYNLERRYNNLAGFGEGSDYLPKRFLEEPSTMPGSEGHLCELDAMLQEYYKARGWDNGIVPDSKLQELGVV